MKDKGWFVEFPITVLNTAINQVQSASFSMIKDYFTVSPMFSAAYVPQQVYNLFNNQTCAQISAYVKHGYNFVSATTLQCTPNGDAILGCANIAPTIDYCGYVCSFSVMPNVTDCFNAVATQAYNYVQQEQDEQNKSDDKKLLIGGVVLGAATLCCAVGLWKLSKSKTSTNTESERLKPEETSSYGTSSPSPV